MGEDEVSVRLVAFLTNLSFIRNAFTEIARVSKESEEQSLWLSSLLMIESLDSFQDTLVSYVQRESDATEEGRQQEDD